MPSVYKKKTCPQCGIEHRQRGPNCSKACSNKGREVSDRQRDNMREVAKERTGTPEAIAGGHLLKMGIRSVAEDYSIQIPDFPELPEGYDIADDW
jgi:hypothetical protein